MRGAVWVGSVEIFAHTEAAAIPCEVFHGGRWSLRQRPRMVSPTAELIERIWQQAPPGREAACVNELLRAMRELLTPRPKNK
jgi:hypothetical protein